MEDEGTEVIIRVTIEFSQEEYELLKAKRDPTQRLDNFIHDIVIRSLRRKVRKAKTEHDMERKQLPV